MNSIDFTNGREVVLEEVLNWREKRVTIQNNLVNDYKDSSTIAFKLNIPGPIKKNKDINTLFVNSVLYLKKVLKNNEIKIINEKDYFLNNTGPEIFLVIEENPYKVKNLMVDIEDNFDYGRIFDIDVYYFNKKISNISRRDIGKESRKCYICNEYASVCGRNRTHSVNDMQKAINDLLLKFN